MMTNGINPIESNAEVQRDWIALLSDERIDDSMHTTLSEVKLANNGNDA